ncbi:MAG: SHOCT domain-containing protein [Chloroflexi bacterium]|nr:SHOCT domain-containing protein [Chloroflexota bacterium]
MWDMHGGGGWWMISGWLWVILFWAVVIGLVVWVVGRLTGRRELPPGQERVTPQEIARMRYARGEISREEFEQIIRDLSER